MTNTDDTTDVKPDTLLALHGSAEALHANLVKSLNAAEGVAIDPEQPADFVVGVAQQLGNTGTGYAPNYADHALAAYQTGLATAMLAFARAHLPAKFQPAAELAALAVDEALDNDPTNNAEAYQHGVQAVVAAGEALLHKGGA